MYEVTFQDYQVPPNQNFQPGDTIPDDPPPPDPSTFTEFEEDVETILTGTGGTISNEDLSLVNPDEWETFLMQLLGFVDAAQSHGSDQNSYYDDHSNEAPMGEYFIAIWGWLHSVQELPGYHYYDYLTQDIDPEFLEWAYAIHTAESLFRNAGGSLTTIENMPFTLIVDGTWLTVTWHSGPPPTTNLNSDPDDPDRIVVHANLGYFTVESQNTSPMGGDLPPVATDLLQSGEQNAPWEPALGQALNYLGQDPTALQLLIAAWHHGTKIRIVTGQAPTQYLDGSDVVEWNPTLGLRLINNDGSDGGLLSPAMCLLHELAHAVFNFFGRDFDYQTLEDRYIVEHVEQVVGRHLGEPIRENHRGTFEHAYTVIYHLPPPPH